MLSRTGEMLRKLKSYLFLEHRIPTYQQRAEYYKQRAILESMKEGVFIDPDKAVDIIDVTETTSIALPTGNQVEFARDSNGIYFAKIEGSKYYPIDTKFPEVLLESSREYEKLSRNFWRRLLREPYERTLGPTMFELETEVIGLSDSFFRLYLTIDSFTRRLQSMTENLNQSTEHFEKTVRELPESEENTSI